MNECINKFIHFIIHSHINRTGDAQGVTYGSHYRNEVIVIVSRLVKICYQDEKDIPSDAIIAIRELITGTHLWIYICIYIYICVCVVLHIYINMYMFTHVDEQISIIVLYTFLDAN